MLISIMCRKLENSIISCGDYRLLKVLLNSMNMVLGIVVMVIIIFMVKGLFVSFSIS